MAPFYLGSHFSLILSASAIILTFFGTFYTCHSHGAYWNFNHQAYQRLHHKLHSKLKTFNEDAKASVDGLIREMERNLTVFKDRVEKEALKVRNCSQDFKSNPTLKFLCFYAISGGDVGEEHEEEEEDEESWIRKQRPIEIPVPTTSLPSAVTPPPSLPSSTVTPTTSTTTSPSPPLPPPPTLPPPKLGDLINPDQVNKTDTSYNADVLCQKIQIDPEDSHIHQPIRTISCCQSGDQHCTYDQNESTRTKYVARCHTKSRDATDYVTQCCEKYGYAAVESPDYFRLTSNYKCY